MDEEHLKDLKEKFLSGDLTETEQAELNALRRQHASLDAFVVDNQKMEAAVRKASEAAFTPGFENRVMARIAAERQTANDFFSLEVSDLISHFFPRLAGPAFIAASMIMALNFSTAAAETPFVDALLGLPAPSYNDWIIPF